ncbi:MAG: hypothetical protein OEU50_05160 [Gammaproteobacteria bacterium]|nr:hypothetical protein [Gammaproteobacteria bacterium]
MNEGKLPRNTGVTNSVGKHHPRRKRRKTKLLVAIGLLLKSRRILHVIVEPAHLAIEGRGIEHPDRRHPHAGHSLHKSRPVMIQQPLAQVFVSGAAIDQAGTVAMAAKQ